jgi:hypothetical protein
MKSSPLMYTRDPSFADLFSSGLARAKTQRRRLHTRPRPRRPTHPRTRPSSHLPTRPHHRRRRRGAARATSTIPRTTTSARGRLITTLSLRPGSELVCAEGRKGCSPSPVRCPTTDIKRARPSHSPPPSPRPRVLSSRPSIVVPKPAVPRALGPLISLAPGRLPSVAGVAGRSRSAQLPPPHRPICPRPSATLLLAPRSAPAHQPILRLRLAASRNDPPRARVAARASRLARP